ncbi:MAG TPA: hypothetical protein VMH27_09180 [Puia sp.]|nr:hypothetical protein [Puia sp.]
MYSVTDQHIEYILGDLRSRGITIPDLRQNLLDHICILIELNLEEGQDFETYYQSILPLFYREEMAEIEQEANFLLKHRRPFLLLSRGQFLLGLFIVLVGPFVSTGVLYFLRTNRLPLEIWGGILIFAQFPLWIWIVVAFTPDRFDPLLPRGARVLIGRKPLISIL